MRRIAEILIACGLAGVFAGSFEAFRALGSGLAPPGLGAKCLSILAGAGLVAPLGFGLGLVLLVPLLLWPPERWGVWLRRLDASWVYGFGVTLPFLAAAHFRLAYHFGTAYHNRALASLGWTLAALFVTLLFGLFVAISVFAVRRAERRWSRIGQLRWALPCVALWWLLLGLPGYLGGPDRALSGIFGFVGLFRKDTLDWGPVTVLLTMLVTCGLGLWLGRRCSPRLGLALGALVIVSLPIGVWAGASPSARPLVLNQTLFARLTLRRLQKLGDHDGDGYARWLGGGDCDDNDKRRYPGAPRSWAMVGTRIATARISSL